MTFASKLMSFKMMFFTTEQRTFIVRTYFQTNSVAEVQERFRMTFPDREPPARNSILYNVRKYNTNGTSLNRHKNNSGRRRTATSNENVEAVRALLEENPNVSARRNPIRISKSSFNLITKHRIRWHPYRMHIRHGLTEGDLPWRLRFSNWFLQRCRDFRFLPNFVISDEAKFQMNGEVNTQTTRQYAPIGEPPAFNYDTNTSREKLDVWAGLCGNGVVIGPFFLDGNLDGLGYYNLLIEQVFPALMEAFAVQFQNDNFLRLWWAHDGAPAHKLIMAKELLIEMFQDHVVIPHHDPEWPARSPDLTPCDFFLWGYMKGKVFSTPPATIEELRERIVREFDLLKRRPAMVRSAVRLMESCVNLCIERQEQHVVT